MPHLTLSITPNGPLIDVLVGVSAPRQAALQKAGQPVPQPVPARLLIDTGASGTVLDPDILSQLSINPTGIISAHTPTTAGTPCQMQQYDVSLLIPNPNLSRHFPAVAVVEAAMKAQGIDGLLGRDVLADCLLVYTGPDNAFILST